jgi:hypothetical protein
MIAIAFSHTVKLVGVNKEPMKYLLEAMLVLTKLVSPQLQSVNTPSEDKPI